MSFFNSTLYWPRIDEGCEWSWKPFLLCVLPQVEAMRDAYQAWIKLSGSEQRMTRNLLGSLITNRDPGLERSYRMIKALIETFEEWSTMQDGKGACGFSPSLTIITDNFIQDLKAALITFERLVRKGGEFRTRTPSPTMPAPPRSSPSSGGGCGIPLDEIPISPIPGPSSAPGYGDAATASPPPNYSKRSKMGDEDHVRRSSGTGDTYTAHLNETVPMPASCSSSRDCYEKLTSCIDAPRFDAASDSDEDGNQFQTAQHSSADATGSASSLDSLDGLFNGDGDTSRDSADRARRSMSISPIRSSTPVDNTTHAFSHNLHEGSISAADKENMTPRDARQ